MGNDLRAAYVPGVPLTGTGQKVGLFQLNAGFYQSDIALYERLAGLPNAPLTTVLLDKYSGAASQANSEVSLDIEMLISMAPGVANIAVFESYSPDDTLSEMAAPTQGEPFCRRLSSSWKFPTDATTSQVFQELAAQRQSFFNASGDSVEVNCALSPNLWAPLPHKLEKPIWDKHPELRSASFQVSG